MFEKYFELLAWQFPQYLVTKGHAMTRELRKEKEGKRLEGSYYWLC